MAHRGIDGNNTYEVHQNVAIGQAHEEPAHSGFERRVLLRLRQGRSDSGEQCLMLPLIRGNSRQCRSQWTLVPGAAQVIKRKRRRLLAAGQHLQQFCERTGASSAQPDVLDARHGGASGQ